MSEEKQAKKGCKKARRGSHEIHRNRSKGKGNKGGRDAFAIMSREARLLARALDALPNGRLMDRMADQHKWWDRHTHLFLHPRQS